MESFGYSEGDYIPSELSGLPATQIHHLDPRGMGGSKLKDTKENLMALTFPEHEQAENRRKPFLSREYLQKKHDEFICGKMKT